MFIYALALILYFYLPGIYLDVVLAALLCSAIVITWCFSPVDHPNKPLKTEDKEKNKKISRRLVLGQAAIIILVSLWKPELKQYLLWAAAGTAMTSFTLFYVVVWNPYKSERRERDENKFF